MHNLGEKIIHAQTGHLQIDLKNYYKAGRHRFPWAT
jgi:hypothetical protein